MRKVIQNELWNVFGYEVSVETRKMPCWLLTANDRARRNLPTTGEAPLLRYNNKYFGILLKNKPISNLLFALWQFNQAEPPFIDETSITGNIDLDLDVVMTDFNAVKKALREYGLDLVKGERAMRVIVIKDHSK